MTQERDTIASIIAGIDAALNTDPNEPRRFCLVIWDERREAPIFFGGNDDDPQATMKMLAIASEGIESVHGIEGGHA
jgi:hypothetical protein